MIKTDLCSLSRGKTAMPREQLVQDLTRCDLIFHSILASSSKAVGGLCCNARSLTCIFTLAQNMGSAVHRWLQSWNMDPSITWTLLLRTWKQKIISNSSVFFCPTHLHCRRGVGVVGASQKTCRFHWIGRKIPSRCNTLRGMRMRRISQSIYCRWTDTEEPCK